MFSVAKDASLAGDEVGEIPKYYQAVTLLLCSPRLLASAREAFDRSQRASANNGQNAESTIKLRLRFGGRG